MEYKIFKSSDTNVSKFVFETEYNSNYKPAIAEAVLYRYGSYKERTVICCSVQSGCPVGCTFCGTGKFFVRDLTYKEIVEQVDTILENIDCSPDEIKKFQASKGVEAYVGQYQSVYLWFLIPAFLILLFDFLLSEHKDKWQYNFQKFIHKN